MLDLGLYDRVHLHPRPLAQRVVADGFLRFNYRSVEIVLEGLENLPERPVVLAMNHTDNFSYWPLQYSLHRRDSYTATWVKGKNYEPKVLGLAMRLTNNIPIASRGYVVTRDFVNVVGRRPEAEEYRALRDAVDEARPVDPTKVPRVVLEQSRDMLGRRFDADHESYEVAVDALMHRMMERFVEMNAEALDLGLNLLVFPQGTRSIRLSRGHIGLAQIALHLDAPIVPIGCSGCDLVYPGRSLVAKPGRVVYRIGKPMSDWGELAPTEPFAPFSRAAEAAHRPRFQAVVDRVMDEINELVDPEYRYADDQRSDGSRGTDRFL